MTAYPVISVVVCTYNRCELLSDALARLLEQDPADIGYEVIVVDNNSTDRTRELVESLMENHSRLRYLREYRQGLSHARNAGIAHADGAIIAFTDDDVRVEANWIRKLSRAFEEHPEIVCVGGRVLPEWESPAPGWLTRDHWSPLGVQDYGERSCYVNAERRLCLIGANLAFRREVFARVGLFEPELQRVKGGIGSNEDMEFHLRLWQSGEQSMYLPELSAAGFVPAERMRRSYHRRRHRGHGYYYALMREEKFEQSSGRLLDVPRHVFRQMLTAAVAWLRHTLRGRAGQAFLAETRLHFLFSFVGKRSRDYLLEKLRSGPQPRSATG
jgi:glycosyltransferase involved in cell wall biosynthesis